MNSTCLVLSSPTDNVFKKHGCVFNLLVVCTYLLFINEEVAYETRMQYSSTGKAGAGVLGARTTVVDNITPEYCIG